MLDGEDELGGNLHGSGISHAELTVVDQQDLKESGRSRGKSQFIKQIQYSVSLKYNRLLCSHWSLIHPHHIILGQLPSEQIFDELKKEHEMGAILSLVEAFEIRPVLPLILSARATGIEHQVVQEEDFGRMDPEKLAQGTEFINDCLTKNPNKYIYVHCKAGRGRSSTAVIAYMSRYTGCDLYAAWKEVFIARPHISVDKPKVLDLHQFYLSYVEPKNLLESSEHKEWLERAAVDFVRLVKAFRSWWHQHHTVVDKQHRRETRQNGQWGHFLRSVKESVGRGLFTHQGMLQDYLDKLEDAEGRYEQTVRDCVGPQFSLGRKKRYTQDEEEQKQFTGF